MATLQRLEKMGADLSAVSSAGNTLFIAAAEGGRFDEANSWLTNYSSQYRTATNKVKVDDALASVGARPFVETRLAGLLTAAKSLGLVFAETDPNTPMWKRAAYYRLPECARVLGCPPEEQLKIQPRTPEEMAISASWLPDSFPAFQELLGNLLAASTDPTNSASRLLLQMLQGNLRQPTPEAVAFIISRNADPNYEGTDDKSYRNTPLQATIRGTQGSSLVEMPLIQVLVEKGANLNHMSKTSKITPLEVAVWQGDKKLITWMLEHGAKNQEQVTQRSLLLAALHGLNSESAVPLVVKMGVDPYLGHDEKQSAVDFFAGKKDLLSLREFDTKVVYRTLMDKYTPPKDSPFVGTWSNGKDEFGTFGVTLNDEGLAIVAASIAPFGPFRWRIEGKQAVIELEQGGQVMDMTFEFTADGKSLTLIKPNGGETQILKKQPGKPPTAVQIRALRGYHTER